MAIKGRASSEGAASNGLTPSSEEHAAARSGLGPERMVEIQRARMLAAMVEACAEHGPAHVTVAGVVERAGVSRRTFYEIFDDCDDCLLAALDEGLQRVSEHVLPVYRKGGRWSERIRASLVALLEFFDAEPIMGGLLVVGSLGAGPRALERRRRVLAHLIAAVEEGRGESRAGGEPPPLTAEGIVGGVLSILHDRLLALPLLPVMRGPAIAPSASQEGDLLGLTGPLMGMIVLPYLGSAAARRELQRPVPKRRVTGPRGGGSDPLRDLGLRLTYRTVRALVSVANKPGSSNREIGEAAGISDQGQMSKLLWRLERFGLVQNAGLGPGTGAPNVWTLTDRGEAIHNAITGQGTVAR
jgi:AcrR family transcriptional regulator